MQVTAVEVDTLGKEVGKCTRQWTTNDEKNTNKHFQHFVTSSGKRRQTVNNEKKKEAEKRADEKEAIKF